MYELEFRGNKKDLEDGIKFCTHRIVDLLDEIDILRKRRKILIQKQKILFDEEQTIIAKELIKND